MEFVYSLSLRGKVCCPRRFRTMWSFATSEECVWQDLWLCMLSSFITGFLAFTPNFKDFFTYVFRFPFLSSCFFHLFFVFLVNINIIIDEFVFLIFLLIFLYFHGATYLRPFTYFPVIFLIFSLINGILVTRASFRCGHREVLSEFPRRLHQS